MAVNQPQCWNNSWEGLFFGHVERHTRIDTWEICFPLPCTGTCSIRYYSTYPSGTGTCFVDFGCGQRRGWGWPPRSECCEGRAPGEWLFRAPPPTPVRPRSWRSASIKSDNAHLLPSFKGKEANQSCLQCLFIHFSFCCGCGLRLSVLVGKKNIRQLLNYLSQSQTNCKESKSGKVKLQ